MRFLDAFRNPRDRHWQGTPRWGPSLLLPISILFILAWIVTIAALAYSRVLSDRYNAARARKDSSADYPPIRWSGYHHDSEGPLEMLYPFVVLGLETIHLPLHMYCFATSRLHLIAALVLCIVCAGSWVGLGFWVFMMDWGAEREFPPAWESLTYTRVALAFVIGLLYLIYIGYAAAAVHKWRMWRRERVRMGVKDDEEEDGQVLTTMPSSASNVSA